MDFLRFDHIVYHVRGREKYSKISFIQCHRRHLGAVSLDISLEIRIQEVDHNTLKSSDRISSFSFYVKERRVINILKIRKLKSVGGVDRQSLLRRSLLRRSLLRRLLLRRSLLRPIAVEVINLMHLILGGNQSTITVEMIAVETIAVEAIAVETNHC